jgi:hypothetical protein
MLFKPVSDPDGNEVEGQLSAVSSPAQHKIPRHRGNPSPRSVNFVLTFYVHKPRIDLAMHEKAVVVRFKYRYSALHRKLNITHV